MFATLIGILLIIGISDLLVTIQVLRHAEYRRGQKAAQLFVVWLLPIFGALATYFFLRETDDSAAVSDSGLADRVAADVASKVDASGEASAMNLSDATERARPQ